MKRHLADEQATIAFAEAVYRALASDVAGWTLLLRGELGAGKSTFARAFIRAAGHQGTVPSPTYTLVEPYTLSTGLFYHIDLYRVSSEDELHYLGLDELDDGCCLIEWPERAPGIVARADLDLAFSYEVSGRTVCASGLSERGRALIQKIN
ncbi:MAG TPA: tRNA (adenosine(37)-N6)-threonylcarbamoyltransferase complex ATPase subunit type 1 TsaE [Woeseiaceae bacterium]|nr:tRNA (adenosine(37)-N6)-threonylcarbamoyltransferase complex ATPase subunit type 1 TsaE [Woeseiaceae bacterium]